MKPSRRRFTKLLVLISTITAIAPFSALGKYLTVPSAGVVQVRRVKIVNRKNLPVNNRLMFSYPTPDRPAILLHIGPDEYEIGNFWEESKRIALNEDRFTAYDGTCTHLGCPVGWIPPEKKMGPSCHGGRFSPVDGSVRAGPPRRRLPKIKLEIEANGDIYAAGYEAGLPLYGWENRKLEYKDEDKH